MKKQTLDIIRRDFPELERQRLQEIIIERAKKEKEKLLKEYNNLTGSHRGRYIAADLFKELFIEFNLSRESRNYINPVVHNSTAALSNLKFHSVLNEKNVNNKNTVMFLTGIPGAGKTSSISEFNLDTHPTLKMIFEGQLSQPKAGIEKIRAALESGHQVEIVAINPIIEKALDNTYNRFNEYGRGATIGVMAKIQGNLSDGLKEIHNEFGDKVKLTIVDKTQAEDKIYQGWKNLEKLKSQGTEKEVYEKLGNKLLADYKLGRISQECMMQAGGISIIKERSNFQEKTNEIFIKTLANKTVLAYERKSLVEELENKKKQQEKLERELVQTNKKKQSRSR